MVEAPNRLGPAGPCRYLPIAEHGLIGDLRTVALVGSNGTIDWYCCPSFDAPSVFAAILDADRGGSFELAADLSARTKQFYFPDTNVLITRFFTDDGVGEVQDFMPLGDADEADRHRLIRRVLCVRGSIPFRARVAPSFGYGLEPHTVRRHDGLILFESTDLSLALTATVPIECDARDAWAEFTLGEGESAVFALDRMDGDVAPRGCPHAEAEEQFANTVAFWRRWLSASRYRGRWREMVHRSALTLKLLTYAPTGAIVAAPTTSLPEQLGGERNWDYRVRLGARRRLLHLRAAEAGVHRRGRGLHELLDQALPARRRPLGPAADHVRHRRAYRTARTHARPLGGISGLRAGAGR